MMKTTTTTRNKNATKYIETRNHYYDNAKEMIGKGELRKASEMLWGAVTQTLKALAALKGIEFKKHGTFFSLTEQLSKERKDPSLYNEFVDLNTLHTNFYDEVIPIGAFPMFYDKTRTYIEKLQVIIHDVMKKQERGEKKLKS
jgi:intein/homing endonuclease